MVKLQTSDGHLIEIEHEYAVKSLLLKNLLKYTKVIEPIKINVELKTMDLVYYFMMTDKHELRENYSPLEIYFPKEYFQFFDGISAENIIKTSNAANYLEYNFLLELCCKIISNELASNAKSELAELVRGKEKIEKKIQKKLEKEYNWYNDSV